MNYIKLINKFWEIRRERDDFDPYVISLYFALTNAANSNNWDEFSAYREDIVAMAGMSPSAYYKSRKILQDAGLIGFKEGANKLSKCVFTVFPLYATNTVNDTLQRHNKDSNLYTTKTEDDTILNKQVNTKTNKVNKPIKTSSLHQSAIAAFCEFYLSNFKTAYIFQGGKDGTAVKNLLSKIERKTKEADMEPTDENILHGFKLFLESITDKWVMDNLTPALLNSKFNELFKNAKNGTTSKSKSDHSDYIELVRQRKQQGYTVHSQAS